MNVLFVVEAVLQINKGERGDVYRLPHVSAPTIKNDMMRVLEGAERKATVSTALRGG